MNKLKIYLDTSVISHLEQNEHHEKQEDTLKLWEEIKQGKYEIFISDITKIEIEDCSEPKRSILLKHFDEIKFENIELNDKIQELALEIIKSKILTKRSLDDCTHIGAALFVNCDIIVSWNFKHLVNVRTISGIREITLKNHYKQIDIYSPTMLINRGDDEND